MTRRKTISITVSPYLWEKFCAMHAKGARATRFDELLAAELGVAIPGRCRRGRPKKVS